MLLVSIGVRQNRMNTVRPSRRRIHMTSHLASRQRRLERQRMRLQAMVAVIPIIPRLPHPRMEVRIQDTRLPPSLLLPGPSQRTRTHLTNSPADGITLRSLLIPLTQRRPQTPMDASRPPKRPSTLLQVPQQPLLATTLPLTVVNIPCRNNLNRHAIHSLVPLGTVQDRVHLH